MKLVAIAPPYGDAIIYASPYYFSGTVHGAKSSATVSLHRTFTAVDCKLIETGPFVTVSQQSPEPQKTRGTQAIAPRLNQLF